MATESVTQHHPDEEERAGDLKPAPSMESQKPGISSASAAGEDDEGVEVVLEGKTTLVDDSPPRIAHQQDQNVFRPPRPVRPRAVRAQGGTNGPPPPPPPPPPGSSGGGGGGMMASLNNFYVSNSMMATVKKNVTEWYV